MAGSFVENVNLLVSKVDVIEEANALFDEGIIPVMQEIALLDLEEAILDLKKGNYLGNRKVDINLALNMQGVTEDLINKSPDLAEAIWTDATKTVLYDKATVTYVDGVVIDLPFIFDGYPTTISTHGELLAQFTRLDYVYAQAQVDSIYQVTVGDTTDYVVTIDSAPFTYTSGVGATRESIIAGLANMINAAAVPITANVTDAGTKLSMTADVAGNPFFATVSPNMAIDTIVDNIIEGPRETAFLSKLENTLAANFASPVVGEIVRVYDVIGLTSNVERIQLHAVSGDYVTATPVYYWAKTTSAFQTLSMRANDIIKLGSEIDNIIALANNIQEVIEVQNRLPELIDTYDVNGNPNGDTTIYNNLTELVAVYDKLIEIIVVYNDIKVGGTNYTNTVATNLTGSNTVGIVAADLVLGINSTVKKTADNIASVVTVAHDINNVNSVADNSANINSVATTIVPNMAEILLADTNAATATTKAAEATSAAATATTKSNEIKNVSVGSTVTGAAGTSASVVYNAITGKFTFVVPQGIKGDKGEAFQVNAVGLLVGRSLYDTAVTGFSYLATDESKIYFKLSATSGDWSTGAPFGKGDTGATGATGTSIVSTTFTSTTDVSGLAGQSGATDTYTILYSDLGTDEFVVKNGIDGLSTVIDTLESVVGANAASYTVTIDTTSGIFEVYLNGLLLPTASYTLTGTTVVVNTAVVAGDEVTVKKIYAVDVLDSYSQSAIDTKIIEVGLQSKNYTDISMATGNSATSTKLHTPININGVSFDGSSNITVSDSTAVKLTGNETIAGTKTFSSNIVGSITGNAATATKLATSKTINGVAFDGTANITAPTNLGITAGTTAGPIITSSTGTNATLPTASATESGVVTTGTQTIAGVKTFSSNIVGNVTGNLSGNATSATKLTTTRNIALTGDITGNVNFDGSENVSIATTIAANSVALGTDTTGNYVAGVAQGTGISVAGTAGEGWSPTISLTNTGTSGTYRSVTTDAQGRVTSGTNPTTVTGYGITDAYTKVEVDNSLAAKQATLVSGTNIKTINGGSILGSGNISTADTTKLPLAGGTMTGAITAIRETKVAMGANDINLAQGNLFTKTISGVTTLTISNALAAGNVNSFVLELTNGGSAVITWFSGVKWAGGIAPTLTTSGKDILGFYSHDGGTTWNILGVNKDVK